MGTTKIKTFPVIISISLVILTEAASRHLGLFPIWSTAVARVIDIVTMFLVFQLSPGGTTALGLSTQKMLYRFKRGILWSILFGAASGCIGIILFLSGMNPLKLIHMAMPRGAYEILLFYIVGGIIGPVAEEMFFRGIIYGYLRTQLVHQNATFGILIAGSISTIVFVLAHSGASGIPLPQLAGGILFVVAYEVEGSLIAPMVIHSIGNMALFTLSLI
jgi:uncharacterized protein